MNRFALSLGLLLGFMSICATAVPIAVERPKGPAPELALLRYSGGKFILSRTRVLSVKARVSKGATPVQKGTAVVQKKRPMIERFVEERAIEEFDVYNLSGVRYKGRYLSQLVKWLGGQKRPSRILLSTNGRIVDPYYRGFAKSGTLVLVPKKRSTAASQRSIRTGSRTRKSVRAMKPKTALSKPTSPQNRTTLPNRSLTNDSIPNRSLPGPRNVRVTFYNTGQQLVHVFWIDYEGREKEYSVLEPQERMTEQSGFAHLWRFKVYGETIAAYRVRRQSMQDYLIRPLKQTLTKVEADVLELVNVARRNSGLQPLRHDRRLSAASRDHSRQMSRTGNFSHTSWVVGKSSFVDRAIVFGTSANSENIAWDNGDAQSVVNMWLNSPGHRANMLDPHSTTMGIGRSGVYWTQMFGSAPERVTTD